MGTVIDPADICEYAGVNEFHIERKSRVVVVPNHRELKKLANHLGKYALSSFANSFEAYGWLYVIGDTNLDEVATQIE